MRLERQGHRSAALLEAQPVPGGGFISWSRLAQILEAHGEVPEGVWRIECFSLDGSRGLNVWVRPAKDDDGEDEA